MKKHLILIALFATVSALPAQAGLLSLGSGLAVGAGSSGFGTSGQAGADMSVNTTGIEKTKGLMAHDDAALSGSIDADTGSSAAASGSAGSSRGKHSKGLLKPAAGLDAKAQVNTSVGAGLPQSLPQAGTVTPGLSSHTEANAYGAYNR